MNTEHAIVVKNLTKKYDDFLLDHLNFEIPQGTIVGYVGENGAGKSTTMKAMLGLMPIDAGEVTLLGHKVEQGEAESAYKEHIGVVFDECNFPEYLKVKYVNAIMKEVYRKWDEKKCKDFLVRFGLPENKTVRELSRGMKMKLSLAVALSHDSKLLILDEATSGLDPVVRSEILDIFREFIEDETHTVFLSSHIISDIEKIADYVMLIHKGKLLFMENKDELLYRYGIVSCSLKQAQLIPEALIVGSRKSEFAVEVLVKDRGEIEKSDFQKAANACGDGPVIIEKVGMEELLLYYIGREEK